MVHPKWHRMLTLAALLLTTLFAVSAALAASPSADAKATSCLQTIKEDLGTVLPGSAFSDRISECPLSGVADRGIIPVTGAADTSSSYRDAGASAPATFEGYLDAGASYTNMYGQRNSSAGGR
jgi:hypothetical protein